MTCDFECRVQKLCPTYASMYYSNTPSIKFAIKNKFNYESNKVGRNGFRPNWKNGSNK